MTELCQGANLGLCLQGGASEQDGGPDAVRFEALASFDPMTDLPLWIPQ